VTWSKTKPLARATMHCVLCTSLLPPWSWQDRPAGALLRGVSPAVLYHRHHSTHSTHRISINCHSINCAQCHLLCLSCLGRLHPLVRLELQTCLASSGLQGNAAQQSTACAHCHHCTCYWVCCDEHRGLVQLLQACRDNAEQHAHTVTDSDAASQLDMTSLLYWVL
jgi:hypothetical protein